MDGRRSIITETFELLFFFLFFLLFFFFFFLFLLFFFFLFFLEVSTGRGISTTLIFVFRGVGVTSLLAWPLAEPLGQLGLGTLQPFIVFLLPQSLEMFSSDNFPASFVELSPIFVGPGVSPTLVFGVHTDLGRIFASESLRIETLLHSLLPQLLFLSLLELFQVIVLPLLSFLQIVFLSLEPDNGVPQLLGLAHKSVRVHFIDIQRLDSDGQRDLFLFFELLLGLGHLPASILNISNISAGFAGLATCGLLLLLLSLHHGLTFHFSLLPTFLLLFGLFLAKSFFFFLLLLGQFLFLLSSDLLALGLLFLEPLQFIFLLGALFAPFVDVFPKLFIQFTLLLLGFQESLALFGGLGGDLLFLIVFFVRHGESATCDQDLLVPTRALYVRGESLRLPM